MKKLVILFIMVFSFANSYLFITSPKSDQIQKAILCRQYIYDLKKLNEILMLLYSNKSFKMASKTAELSFKNTISKYSVEYIEDFLKVLNGEDMQTNKGYIKYVEDICENYNPYINPDLNIIIKNFDVLKRKIQKQLKLLEYNLNNRKNIRPYLKDIFKDLIFAFEDIKDQTKTFKFKPFTEYDDKKYSMPKNYAQPDGDTTLVDIINFILNGDDRYKIYGIRDYYENIYLRGVPLIISF